MRGNERKPPAGGSRADVFTIPMRGNEGLALVKPEDDPRMFTIPMRGNEASETVWSSAVSRVYDPHEG